MKKIIVILSFLFICSIFLPHLAVASETSKKANLNWIDSEDRSFLELSYLNERGLLDPEHISSLWFLIDQPANRLTALVFIGKLLGVDASPADTSFIDVNKTTPFSGYISEAVKKGIAKGKSDHFFEPGETLTRAELATFLYRALSTYLPEDESLTFSDVSTKHYAYAAVQSMATAKITSGYTDHTFRPNVTLSNRQLITFMYRTVKYLESQSIPVPLDSKEKREAAAALEKQEQKEAIATYSAKSLEKYLNDNYATLETKYKTVNFKYEVTENTSTDYRYDYLISTSYNYIDFSNALYRVKNSIIYTEEDAKEVAKAEQQYLDFVEDMAQDAIRKSSGKKLQGREYESGYRYEYIKEGYYSRENLTWTNFDAIAMKTSWPGDRPSDYSIIYGYNDPSKDIEKKKQYRADESARNDYIREYRSLKYKDVEITKFHWVYFLDGTYDS